MEIDARLISNAIKVTNLPKQIRNWRIGQLLEAKVVSISRQNVITLNIDEQSVEATLSKPLPKGSSHPFQPGNQIRLEVTMSEGKPALKVVMEDQMVSIDAKLSQLIRAALPAQDSIEPLVKNLSYLLKLANGSVESEPKSDNTAKAGTENPVKSDKTTPETQTSPPKGSQEKAGEALDKPAKGSIAKGTIDSPDKSPTGTRNTVVSDKADVRNLSPKTQTPRQESSSTPPQNSTDKPAGKDNSLNSYQAPSFKRGKAVPLPDSRVVTSPAPEKPGVQGKATQNISTNTQTTDTPKNQPQSSVSGSTTPNQTSSAITPQTLAQIPKIKLILDAANQLLQSFPSHSLMTTGSSQERSDAIEQLVRFSGLFLENHLKDAQSGPLLSKDLRTQLIKLKQLIDDATQTISDKSKDSSSSGSKQTGAYSQNDASSTTNKSKSETLTYQKLGEAAKAKANQTGQEPSATNPSRPTPTNQELKLMTLRWFQQLNSGLKNLQKLAQLPLSTSTFKLTKPGNISLPLPGTRLPGAVPNQPQPSASPPLKEFSLRPPDSQMAATLQKMGAGESLDVLKELGRQTEASLSRIQLGQTNLPQPDTPAHLMIDVPIMRDGLVDLFQMRFIQDYEDAPSQGRRKQQRWMVELSFDLAPLGAVTARIQLGHEHVKANLWAEKPAVAQLINDNLFNLSASLRSIGLVVDDIYCQSGQAPVLQNLPPAKGILDEHV